MKETTTTINSSLLKCESKLIQLGYKAQEGQPWDVDDLTSCGWFRTTSGKICTYRLTGPPFDASFAYKWKLEYYVGNSLKYSLIEDAIGNSVGQDL